MGKRTAIGEFRHKTWTNLNIRAGKYRHLQTVNRCYSYSNVKIIFTQQEFKEWCYQHENLINNLSRPSLDRIDNKKDYTLDNIQIIELSENIAKEKRKGTLTHGTCWKCGIFKSKEAFSKETRRWSGFSTLCIKCLSLKRSTNSET